MNDSRLLKIKISVMALSTLQMASTAITPGMAGLSAHFSDVSPSASQMMLSLPALFVVPFALFSGSLVTIFSKKTLLLLGVALTGVGGLAPIILDNFTCMLIMRAVLGVGVGLIVPIAPSVLTDFFSGHELSTAMGHYGSFACFGGILNTLVGGLLASIDWRYNFFVYLTVIPIFLSVLFFLPDDGKVSREVPPDRVRIEPKALYLSLICLLFSTAKFVFTMNISLFVSEENLGNSTLTGLISSIYTAGGFFAGFLFGKLAKACKAYTLATGMLFAAGGMAIVFLAHDIRILMVGAFLLGTALSVVNPRLNVMMSEVASPRSLALSLAILLATMNLGQFAAPIVFNTLGNILGLTTRRSQFLLASIALAILGLGSLLATYTRNHKASKDFYSAG